MIVDDLTPDFLAFWDRAAGLDVAEQTRLWHALYEGPHRAVFEAYHRRDATSDVLATALIRYPEVAARIRTVAPALREGIARVAPEVARLFDVPEGDLRYVLMVGLFSSDGWLDLLDGDPVCFCAVELVEDVGTAPILLAHEAAHGYHARCQPPGFAGMDAVGHALFREGLATLASARAVPGWDEATYLWCGRTETVGGQPVGEWLAACEARWPELRAALLRDLRREDSETYTTHFIPFETPDGPPPKAGYFVGYRLLAELGNDHPVRELARWSPDRALLEVARLLERSERCPTGLSA
jgi:hypothetical protein